MDDQTAQAIRWIAPDLYFPPPAEEPAEVSPEETVFLAEEERQAIISAAREDGFNQGWKQGHAEGFTQGQNEGLALGQTEVQRLSRQLQAIIDNFSYPLRRLENEVIRELGTLAVRIAGYLVRRSYTARPALMQALVNEALQAADSDNTNSTLDIRLHPDDLAALQPLLRLEPHQRLLADSNLQRGDVRVHAPSVRIDASVDSRLDQVIEQLFKPTGNSLLSP